MRIILLSIMLLMSAAHAETAADVIKIKNAYVRATPPGQSVTAAFMQLNNQGKQQHKLVDADSDVAAMVQLHKSANENGVMTMRHVSSIKLMPGKSRALKPGGYHIMMMSLKQALAPGDTVPVTLHFADNTEIKLTIPVQAINGSQQS